MARFSFLNPKITGYLRSNVHLEDTDSNRIEGLVYGIRTMRICACDTCTHASSFKAVCFVLNNGYW